MKHLTCAKRVSRRRLSVLVRSLRGLVSHRSVPPSQLHPPKVPTSVVVRAIRAAQNREEPPPRKVVGRNERVVRGGKVLFFPAPGGAVRIIGLSEADEWIAEFSCREEDFSEVYIRRMEQHVAQKTGVRIAVVS